MAIPIRECGKYNVCYKPPNTQSSLVRFRFIKNHIYPRLRTCYRVKVIEHFSDTLHGRQLVFSYSHVFIKTNFKLLIILIDDKHE